MRSCSATSMTCQLLSDLQPKAGACFSLPSPEVPESLHSSSKQHRDASRSKPENRAMENSEPSPLSADADRSQRTPAQTVKEPPATLLGVRHFHPYLGVTSTVWVSCQEKGQRKHSEEHIHRITALFSQCTSIGRCPDGH